MLAWQLPLLVWRAEGENMHTHRKSWERKLRAGQNGIKLICPKYFQGKIKGILCSHCLILRSAKKYESIKEKSLSCNTYEVFERKANAPSVVKKETWIHHSSLLENRRISMLFKLKKVMDAAMTSLCSKLLFRINTLLVFAQFDFDMSRICGIKETSKKRSSFGVWDLSLD